MLLINTYTCYVIDRRVAPADSMHTFGHVLISKLFHAFAFQRCGRVFISECMKTFVTWKVQRFVLVLCFVAALLFVP